MQDRFLKRLRKKAKKGMHGWPVATIAFYGPDASRASKVVVGIVASEHAEVGEMRDWKLDAGDVRNDPGIAKETRSLYRWCRWRRHCRCFCSRCRQARLPTFSTGANY